MPESEGDSNLRRTLGVVFLYCLLLLLFPLFPLFPPREEGPPGCC